MPRTFVKGQILADFIVERLEDDSLVTTTEVEEELLDPWTLFTDGSSCIDGSRAGLILTNSEGTKFTYTMRFRFDATNNEAEYKALIAGLKIAEQMERSNQQSMKQEARSKAKMEKYYNSKVRKTSFKPGDLVYRNNDANHAKDSRKLGPKWERPCEVTEALGKRAYKHRDRNGELLLRT
nr:reverse transcriptase domain-containing protein [Tanacetum cinerariifolium]